MFVSGFLNFCIESLILGEWFNSFSRNPCGTVNVIFLNLLLFFLLDLQNISLASLISEVTCMARGGGERVV